MLKRRYPGVSPFTERQKNIFYGRDNDIKKLHKLISLRNQVLVYAKSGIGKTSLLNAGVLPKLEQKFNIIKIRFNAYDKQNFVSPTNKVISNIKNKFEETDKQTILHTIAQNNDYKKTLWHYLKQYNLLHKQDIEFILVFDQFEELFSYPNEQIKEFKEQLQQLINDNLPNTVKQFIAENPDIEEQTDILLDDLNIKTVFAIRSDKLSLINKLTDKLPDIQKTFYELAPLNTEQAKQAMVQPAKDKSKFETLPFEFAQQALDTTINTLSNNGEQDIETTQLQIICQSIENIAQEKASKTLKSEPVIITKNDLPDFKDIFLNFYENSVVTALDMAIKSGNFHTTHKQAIIDKIRIFIETQLIRNEQRISLDKIICFDFVDGEILKTLTDTHLLRAERNSTGGFSYELSHDTLIEPILISKKAREEKEAAEEKLRVKNEELRIKREKEKEELRLKNEELRIEKIENEKKRKRQRTIIAIVTVAAFVSILFGIFGFVNMQKAQKQAKNAKQQTEYAIEKEIEATNALIDMKTAQINKLITASKNQIMLEQYFAAMPYLTEAKKIQPENETIDSLINICKDNKIVE